eukprot:m.640524 g.640524  ORF g.640524 m.640524 type:complete len:73 (-) comp58343_c0_seq3:194-412(-)
MLRECSLRFLSWRLLQAHELATQKGDEAALQEIARVQDSIVRTPIRSRADKYKSFSTSRPSDLSVPASMRRT